MRIFEHGTFRFLAVNDVAVKLYENLLAAGADRQYLLNWAGRLDVAGLLEECLNG